MDKSISEKIAYEISQIDETVSDAEPLIKLCKAKKPDLIECSAVALLLHSFYNGIENILLTIMKYKENGSLNGSKWHTELLDNAFEAMNNRSAIFRNEIKETLQDYLSFRHFVRHTYGFRIKWEKMEDKLNNLKEIWKIVKEDLNSFIKNN
ncbi:hypothetical protein [Treponema primitia]|uniref:ribonuclease toxin HepT-like protein n=1 Tax=Treponema primitia TaxID=88058 RepID=UPI00025552AF|nr:hypothetical protein [Treponema primitia]